MKKNEVFLKRIKAEIIFELDQISKLMDEYNDFLAKYSSHMDTYLMRVQASFMADFYMGIERILKLIAEDLNGGVPRGGGWHKKLLSAMTLEIGKVRPPVISNELFQDLQKFLGFRHVVRQAYGFQLDEKKLVELEKIFQKTWKRFAREIKKFCRFLDGK